MEDVYCEVDFSNVLRVGIRADDSQRQLGWKL